MKRTFMFFVFLYAFTFLHGQGDTLFRNFIHEDSLRGYILYVPEAYDGSEEWPLVLNIHGYALDAFFQMVFSDMNPVADTAHFLIAYPQGTIINSTVPNIPPQGLGFIIGGPDDSSFVSPTHVNDVDFMSKIIDHIDADFNVDLSRVYSTGFSNGGFLSTVLASELSDRIAAIAPVGGTIPNSRPFEPEKAVPVLYVFGTADSIAPYGGNDFIKSVSETLEVWAGANACDSEPTVTPLPDIVNSDSSTVELIQWQNCEAEVAHLKITDGGHQWPGGVNLLPFLGFFNQDINTSSEIWKFLSRHRHPNPAGRLVEKSFFQNDSLRSYLMYIPAAYDGSEEWPLVLNYHGFLNTAEDQVFISQMNAIADTAQFLIAYPQGLLINNPAFGTIAPGWNIDGNLSENDDFDFTLKIIEQISTDYAIDQSRIHATGYSLGSLMSFQLACVFPNQIASVAGVASPMIDIQFEFCQPNRPYSTLLIHGTADQITPFEGDGIFFSNAANTPAFWAEQNDCDETPTVSEIEDIIESDSSSVTLFEYNDCDNNAEVLFYQINNGGHTWPSGKKVFDFLGNINQDINASSEIWNFFNRNPLPLSSNTARVQFIHAAANETVDVFANGGLLLDNFAWRTATPYLDIPANTPLAIELVPSNPFSTVQTIDLELEFESGGTYIVVVNGTFDESDPWPVEATVRDDAVERTSDPNKVATTIFQGVPDFPLPIFDVIIIGEEGVLWDDLVYKSFPKHQEVPPGPIEYSSTLADDNSTLITQFVVDFSFWKGKSAVQFNTGLFSDTTWTEPWIALSNGGTYPLRPPMDNQPLIQNNDKIYQLEISPNPASEIINIQFALKEESPVLFDLFDSNGKFVRNIQVGNLSKGIHHFELNIATLPTGLYHLRLQSKNGEEIQTVMITNE